MRCEVSPSTEGLHCDSCHWSRSLQAPDIDRRRPKHCLVCDCDDLWRQKDFPQNLGVGLVALGAVLSTLAIALYMPVTALVVLLAFAFVDLLLFMTMPDVLVCYRCGARHRHAELGEAYPQFSLETAERYRQEAVRLAASRGVAEAPR